VQLFRIDLRGISTVTNVVNTSACNEQTPTVVVIFQYCSRFPYNSIAAKHASTSSVTTAVGVL